jgi:hypothetical protein
VDALTLIPVPLAHRHRQARRQAGLVVFAVALACALTPIAWILLPLVAAQAWRARARPSALLATLTWIFAGFALVDLRAVATYPPLLTGPWVTLVTGAMATSAAWATSRRRSAGELLRAAALVALAAAPWSPLPALLIALGCRLAARDQARPLAANDNDAGGHFATTAIQARLSELPRRSARPAMYD